MFILMLLFIVFSEITLGISVEDFDQNLGIIGGQTVEIEDYPYQLSLSDDGAIGLGLLCGAALISQNWALTTARCVNYAKSIVEFSNGSVTILANSSDIAGGIQVPIKRYIIHPDYLPDYDEKDIALVELEEPVECQFCQPIELGKETPLTEENVTITGWGWSSEFEPYVSTMLQMVQLSVLDTKNCSDILLGTHVLTQNQFCAWDINDTFVGPCGLDEGDPVVANGVLVGLVSQVFGCTGEFPRVFTDITKFLSWIQENTGM